MLKKKKRLIFLSIPYFLAHFSVFQDLSSRVFFLLLIHPNVFRSGWTGLGGTVQGWGNDTSYTIKPSVSSLG